MAALWGRYNSPLATRDLIASTSTVEHLEDPRDSLSVSGEVRCIVVYWYSNTTWLYASCVHHSIARKLHYTPGRFSLVLFLKSRLHQMHRDIADHLHVLRLYLIIRSGVVSCRVVKEFVGLGSVFSFKFHIFAGFKSVPTCRVRVSLYCV